LASKSCNSILRPERSACWRSIVCTRENADETENKCDPKPLGPEPVQLNLWMKIELDKSSG
jgi:hypothetical protein